MFSLAAARATPRGTKRGSPEAGGAAGRPPAERPKKRPRNPKSGQPQLAGEPAGPAAEGARRPLVVTGMPLAAALAAAPAADRQQGVTAWRGVTQRKPQVPGGGTAMQRRGARRML